LREGCSGRWASNPFRRYGLTLTNENSPIAETSRIAMANQEIALALSAVCFGLGIGFIAGYAVRAYISRRRHQRYRE
jgi:DNA-binding transcriptional LysR family regulator